jgi:hypothetical protein
MKRTTQSITVAVMFLGLIAAGMFVFGGSFGNSTSFVTPVRAQETSLPVRASSRHCTIGTVSGSYAYTASGFVTQPIPQAQIPAGPFAVNSLLTLSGGNFSFKGTQSFNGVIVPAVGTGTYTVNDDCTGSATDTNGTPYQFVIADGGNEVRILLGVPNTVVTGVAKRL